MTLEKPAPKAANVSRVRVNLSYKINMGNFETFGLEFGVEADALEGESTRQALERVKELISNELFDEVKRVKEGL